MKNFINVSFQENMGHNYTVTMPALLTTGNFTQNLQC